MRSSHFIDFEKGEVEERLKTSLAKKGTTG